MYRFLPVGVKHGIIVLKAGHRTREKKGSKSKMKRLQDKKANSLDVVEIWIARC